MLFCAELLTDSALEGTADRRTIEDEANKLTLSLDSFELLCCSLELYDRREEPEGLAIDVAGARLAPAEAGAGGVALAVLARRDTELSRAGPFVDGRARGGASNMTSGMDTGTAGGRTGSLLGGTQGREDPAGELASSDA